MRIGIMCKVFFTLNLQIITYSYTHVILPSRTYYPFRTICSSTKSDLTKKRV